MDITSKHIIITSERKKERKKDIGKVTTLACSRFDQFAWWPNIFCSTSRNRFASSSLLLLLCSIHRNCRISASKILLFLWTGNVSNICVLWTRAAFKSRLHTLLWYSYQLLRLMFQYCHETSPVNHRFSDYTHIIRFILSRGFNAKSWRRNAGSITAACFATGESIWNLVTCAP